MPAHLWNNSPLELNNANTNPVGSGPYIIGLVNKQSSGIIDYYKLVPFKKFTLGEPYIENINLHFYQNEDDLIKALVDKKVEEIRSRTKINSWFLRRLESMVVLEKKIKSEKLTKEIILEAKRSGFSAAMS